MQDILIVVDMQNDFITGALGTKEAQEIVPLVKQKIQNFAGSVYFTQDTHFGNYLNTQEGQNLPVVHCVKDTPGWRIHPDLEALRTTEALCKPTFGSVELAQFLMQQNAENPVNSITFIGLCTDICVISNALLVKAFLPEVTLIVDAQCCAGVTPQSHQNALAAMKACQIHIQNESA